MKEKADKLRGTKMAQRYGVHSRTWKRWCEAKKTPAPCGRTPTGDLLWDVSECDALFAEYLSEGEPAAA